MKTFGLIISKSTQSSGATPNGCTFGAPNGVVNTSKLDDELISKYREPLDRLFQNQFKDWGLVGMDIPRVHSGEKTSLGATSSRPSMTSRQGPGEWKQ
jgi:hypothetical protein